MLANDKQYPSRNKVVTLYFLILITKVMIANRVIIFVAICMMTLQCKQRCHAQFESFITHKNALYQLMFLNCLEIYSTQDPTIWITKS